MSHHSVLQRPPANCGNMVASAFVAPVTIEQHTIEEKSREDTIANYTRKWTATKEFSKTCSICLDTMQGGDEVVTLPCFHVFHGKCVADWLIRNEDMACPECDRCIYAPPIESTFSHR